MALFRGAPFEAFPSAAAAGIGEVAVETYLGACPALDGEAVTLGNPEVDVATYLGIDPDAVDALLSSVVFCPLFGVNEIVCAGAGEGTAGIVFGVRFKRGTEVVPVSAGEGGVLFPAAAGGAAFSFAGIFATGTVAVPMNCGVEASPAGEGDEATPTFLIRGDAPAMEEGVLSGEIPVV